MKSAIFITGPTAVGKTALAYKISEKIPVALISADSVQVFCGTDIISGKDLPKSAKRTDKYFRIGKTPLFLVDLVLPTEAFSVYNYVNETRKVIKFAKETKRTPVVVGGTRFYFEALTKNIETLSIPPDEKLRENLKNKSVRGLHDVLSKVDPEKLSKMNNSDRNNPRRLIRAIEVANAKKNSEMKLFEINEVLVLGLFASFEYIKAKIDARLEDRIKQGAIDEAEKLFENYDKLSQQIRNTNGYKQLFEYLKGSITLDEAINRWKQSEYNLAKDQTKWVKEKDISDIFNVENRGYERKIFELIEQNFTS